MMADKIILKDFGPISTLDINLGDLTILIGAQASGKTLFLQMLKLLVDKDQIITTLNKYNYVTEGNVNNILNCYIGEGLSRLWTSKTNKHVRLIIITHTCLFPFHSPYSPLFSYFLPILDNKTEKSLFI